MSLKVAIKLEFRDLVEWVALSLFLLLPKYLYFFIINDVNKKAIWIQHTEVKASPTPESPHHTQKPDIHNSF